MDTGDFKFIDSNGTARTRNPRFAIIYHDADFDGKLSNEVCRYWLNRDHPGATVHSYGWDYGHITPRPLLLGQLPGPEPRPAIQMEDWALYDYIYIVDLSVDELMARPELQNKIVWIDHHKSAIEKWDQPPAEDTFLPDTYRTFTGCRIDGVAACRLCWQWFVRNPSGRGFVEPLTKQLFVDRQVKEPELIRLAGEYDIWDHRDPNGKALQFGLRTLHDEALAVLVHGQFELCGDAQDILESVIKTGRSIKSYVDKQADEYSAAYAHTIKWEGLTFCALNIGQRGNSDLLRGGLKPEHDAGFAWRYDGQKVLVSLYHVPGNEHHDLSKIAVKYGGGGHKGACGFRITLSELEKILNGGAA
jgi:hypothetical protein